MVVGEIVGNHLRMCGYSWSLTWCTTLQVILPPVSSNSSNQMHQEEGELESEQQWLLGLSKLVSSAPGTEASSHTAITSPSRMVRITKPNK